LKKSKFIVRDGGGEKRPQQTSGEWGERGTGLKNIIERGLEGIPTNQTSAKVLLPSGSKNNEGGKEIYPRSEIELMEAIVQPPGLGGPLRIRCNRREN